MLNPGQYGLDESMKDVLRKTLSRADNVNTDVAFSLIF